MKRLLTILVLVTAISCMSFAKTPLNEKNYDKAVESLLEGLNSDNYGLRTSSAFMLGEIKASEAVIPLLKILHNDANEEARIVAALALYKIGSGISIKALKQASRFDSSERVRKMCFNFYNSFNSNDKTHDIQIAQR